MALKIDFHMHTTVSDGTDTPAEILHKVADLGIGAFAVTDHDAEAGCGQILEILGEQDARGAAVAGRGEGSEKGTETAGHEAAAEAVAMPKFVTGVEFAARDDYGKYHIVGLGYDPDSTEIRELVADAHAKRIRRLEIRLQYLQEHFGFYLPEQEIRALYKRDNPGKPHIGNLLVKYGYAPDRSTAITEYINKAKTPGVGRITPDVVIRTILTAGGVPVLAHAVFGDGSEHLDHEELDRRIAALKEYGLEGVEGYYSTFTKEMSKEMLAFAEQYDLYVSAGSDYHGKNKPIALGATGLVDAEKDPRVMKLLSRLSVI